MLKLTENLVWLMVKIFEPNRDTPISYATRPTFNEIVPRCTIKKKKEEEYGIGHT